MGEWFVGEWFVGEWFAEEWFVGEWFVGEWFVLQTRTRVENLGHSFHSHAHHNCSEIITKLMYSWGVISDVM